MTAADGLIEVASLRQAAIVDVDGTLVDVAGIRHLVEGAKPDFDAFHEASVDCPPMYPVLRRVNELAASGVTVIAVSGRSEKYRRLTDFWMALHDVRASELWMRSSRDFRPDVAVKAEMYELLRHRWIVIEAIDDRDELLELWRAVGVPSVLDARSMRE